MARIIVAEDDEGVRNVIRRSLEADGHEVIEAEDGAVALDLFREEPADLLVADLFMPRLDGIKLITHLRKQFPQVRVLAISGSVWERQPKFLEIAGRIDAVTTLAKPFTPKELREAVSRALA